jgi:membrane associated rhomboid family serine protease
VTSALIVLNVIVFILSYFVGMESIDLYGTFIVGVPYFEEQYWRYFTAMFLHADPYHLLFNMFSLLVFCPPMERFLGRWRYLAMYIVSGVVGNIGFLLLNTEPLAMAVGASGAIYGVCGAYLYLAIFKRSLDSDSRRTIYIILALGVVTSFFSNIAWQAHLGGLVAGFVFMFIYDLFMKRDHRYYT